MKITDYKELIKQLPYRDQAFEIKKEIWVFEDDSKPFENQIEQIKQVFKEEKTIIISRNDLLTSKEDLETLVIKILMWGYPTKGRGKNIENLLCPDVFEKLIENLRLLKSKTKIDLSDLTELQKIDRLGLSTLSKFLYFLHINVELCPALILDMQVINAITRTNGFDDEELLPLKKMNYTNAPNHYTQYLKAMNHLASAMNVEPDQIELFLYVFGMNLKANS